ncbi:MAG TPA: zinc-ribbon domain-containing protein [Devosia sp.]|jgi:predicted Zn finger-like uncharacterized protein|uniref:zinc-ribbon domain-containing protein n=1 Tax=Devosia sp. TaxID=1871048 RepID=UPI002F93ADEA
MIITCPHCRTKYQVTYEAIGSAGRKVQCANCQQAWQQTPLSDQIAATAEEQRAFEEISEDGLDEVMAAEERSAAAEKAAKLALEREAEAAQHRAAAVSKADTATLRKRQKDFTKRQSAMVADLPMARLRRTLRIIGSLLLLVIALVAYFGRVQVVERFPAMAGVYAAMGLGVNVVGLDFANVSTLRTLRDGKEVLFVSAQIVGLTPKPSHVPAVVVTLLDAQGEGIYEWSVTPAVRDLMAGERATFDTQLPMPPAEAVRMRLSFAGGQAVPLGAAGGHAPAAATPADAPAATHDEHTAAPQEDHPPATHDEHAAAAPQEHHPAPEHH